MRRLLIAALHRQDMCTISFTASMLKLQVELARAAGSVDVSINFFPNRAEAMRAFTANSFDTVVFIDSYSGVTPEFVLEEPVHDCTITPYPLAKIDWDRVKSKLESKSLESLENLGNVYNFDATRAIPVCPRYLQVPRDAVTEFAVCKLCQGVDVETVEHMYVDLENPSTNHGSVAYLGCAGVRKQLR